MPMKRMDMVLRLLVGMLVPMLASLAVAGCGGGSHSDADAQVGRDGGLGDAGDGQWKDGHVGDDAQESSVQFERNPANPLYQSSGSSWNFAGIGDPCVLYDADAGLYKMWTSAGGTVPPSTDVIVRTQYLTSADGVHWTEHENPVLFEGSGAQDWDRGGVETVTVLHDGQQYWLWYAGYERRENPPVTMKIGVATSSDGISWQKAAENPVIDKGASGEWNESFVESPTVVKVGSMFYMWYTGVDSQMHFRIGMATSSDGVHWTDEPGNPVFAAEPSHDWENGGVYGPAVLRDDDRFVMFYVGLNAQTFLNALRIGMATSPDGISWTRPQAEPVLDVGATGAWDEKGPFVPTVIARDNGYWMWYLSGDNPNEKIGLATWSH